MIKFFVDGKELEGIKIQDMTYTGIPDVQKNCAHCEDKGTKMSVVARDVPDEEYAVLCMNDYYKK